jgi:trimeric autotransporter adhesin
MIGKKRGRWRAEGWALGVAFAASSVAACLLLAGPAHADTLTVNSAGDTGDILPGNGQCRTGGGPPLVGECTLRAAIEEANANDNVLGGVVDEVRFSIPGPGPHIIAPASALPFITEPLVVDGYTQGDATATPADDATENTLRSGDNADLRVRLDGVNLQGLPAGLGVNAADSVVRGLSITRFAVGLELFGPEADNNTVEGNFVGVTPAGKDMGNANNLTLRNGASSNTIGGTTPAKRNLISGSGPSQNFSSTGVTISDVGTDNNRVMGNYVGTTKSGTGSLGNEGRGVFIGNGAVGNLIGDGDFSDGPNNAANTIAFNGLDGVDVSGQGTRANSIFANSIFSNARLGISLGQSPNDGPGDADTGPNDLQNSPVISSAKTARRTTIKGTLESVQNGAFLIHYYASPASTREEGKVFLGVQGVTDTDSDGVISLAFRPKSRTDPGLFVTATATRAVTGDTSAFSAPRKVTGN